MELISYQNALEIILSQKADFGTENVALDFSLNRVLAQDIFADRDYPPFNRSAMDGIAVNIKDIKNSITQFTIVKTIYAGFSCDLILKPGQCFKIMTGAAVPLCADAVIRVEDIVIDQQTATIKSLEVKPFLNIAQQGQDIKNQQLAIAKGVKITPAIIGLLATVGKNCVLVNKMPKVAIITTGAEVKAVNQSVNNVQIRNSNQHLIRALLKQNQIETFYSGHIIDDEELLLDGIKNILNVDVLIICGGVSAGDADYVPAVLNNLGVTKVFHKVAIKPGKPIWCGKKPGGAIVFALPGNPFSCLVTFKIFIEPFLKNTFAQPIYQTKKLPLNNLRTQKTKFDEFFPVIIDYDNNFLKSVDINGSGDVRMGLQATALALHPATKNTITAGEILSFWDLM